METKKYKARLPMIISQFIIFVFSISAAYGFYQGYLESKLLFLFLLIFPLLIMAIVTLMNIIHFILIPVVIITNEKIIGMEIIFRKKSIDIKEIKSIEVSDEKIGSLKISLKNNKEKTFSLSDISKENRNEFLALLKTKLDN